MCKNGGKMADFIKKTLPVSLLGLTAGFLNGLLGDGGGIPLVMGLRCLFGKKVANGRRFFTTALAVMLPLSLFSVYRYAKKAPIPTDLFGGILFPALLGGAVGAWLLGKLPTKILGRIFATVMALSGILMVIR
jgi:uncharacterized membrane protein YfcA